MKDINEKMFHAVFRVMDFDSFVEAVDAGADINSIDPEEGLSIASGFVYWGPRELYRALEVGVDPNIKNRDGSTALTVAISCSEFRCIPVLLGHGAHFELESPESGWTALHRAAENGYYDMIDIIGRSVPKEYLNRFDSSGDTPLMLAVQHNHIDCVKLLLKLGVDVNANDETKAGDTALHYACTNGLPEMVKLLVDNGADKNIKGWMQLTPMDKIPKSSAGLEIKKILNKTPSVR